MHVQDLLAALHVGHVHHDLAVEAAGREQRGVENVGAVGGGDEDNGVVGLKAVHLNEQLVQRLLAFVVAAAQARAALTADGIDFVDEDDGGACFLCLLEQVAYTGGAYAYEHLHEVGTRDAEERNARLAGNGTRQQRFTGARRAHQQTATRNFCAGLVLGGVCQEVLDFLHFLDGFVDAFHLVDSPMGDGPVVGVAPRAGGLHLVLDLGCWAIGRTASCRPPCTCAGHGVVTGAVRDLRDAVLVDRLQELGRHQLIGGALRRLRHAHELLAHEEGHQQEKDNRDDGCPGVGLLNMGFVVLRHRPCFPSCRARASGRRCTAGCGSARRSPGRSPR